VKMPRFGCRSNRSIWDALLYFSPPTTSKETGSGLDRVYLTRLAAPSGFLNLSTPYSSLVPLRACSIPMPFLGLIPFRDFPSREAEHLSVGHAPPGVGTEIPAYRGLSHP
jgi:hypothetical protein